MGPGAKKSRLRKGGEKTTRSRSDGASPTQMTLPSLLARSAKRKSAQMLGSMEADDEVEFICAKRRSPQDNDSSWNTSCSSAQDLELSMESQCISSSRTCMWGQKLEERCSLEAAINPQFRSRPPSSPKRLLARSHIPPLPPLNWAQPQQLWNLMCWKDTVYGRDPQCFQKQKYIEPKMRSILVDWMTEVCEVYKLHRETFYLSVDFLDRYLSREHRVQKHSLQLVGVTALFIAAKLEEIYPPKCAEFAEVTDGACSEDDVRTLEVLMLKTLRWSLTPLTPVHWLMTYVQLMETLRSPVAYPSDADLLFPKFQRGSFLQLTRLLDLCILDEGSFRFSNGVIAASLLYSQLDCPQMACDISGLAFGALAPCLDWLQPFVKVLGDAEEVQPQTFHGVAPDDFHNIQTHEITLDILEKALALKRKPAKMHWSPVCPSLFPTPPNSDEKPSSLVSPFTTP